MKRHSLSSVGVVSVLSILLLSFQNFSFPERYHQSPIIEAGGSNFVMIRQNEFMQDMPEQERNACESGYQTGNSRSVIGVYHIPKAKQKINLYLRQLIQNGQKKISLVIWHFNNPYTYTNDMFCMSLKTRGTLSSQHQKNLKELIIKIKDLGFDQINVRFAPMDQSSPGQWQSWNESAYQDNWNVIVNTRQLVMSSLQQSSLKSTRILFDLGLELGGAWAIPWSHENKPVLHQYIKRLWRNYSENYGPHDTMGFSIVPGHPGMIYAQVGLYDEIGHGRPPAYGFDVYGNQNQVSQGDFSSIETQLKLIKDELEGTKEISKEIFLQETYASSLTMRNLLDGLLMQLRLPVRYIFQWPLQFGTSGANNVQNMGYFQAFLPRGTYFRVGNGVHYANPAQHFCHFPSWNNFTSLTGLSSVEGIPSLGNIPASLRSDGACQ